MTFQVVSMIEFVFNEKFDEKLKAPQTVGCAV